MMKKVYPAIFQKDERGGYYIQFPDVGGVGTQGNELEDGLEFASDYLGLMLSDFVEDGLEFPIATPIDEIEVNADSFVKLVEVELDDYLIRNVGESQRI